MPATSTAHSIEWSLLRAACSTHPEKADALGRLLREPVHWKGLLDLATRHGVQPLLYQALSGVGELVPAEQMSELMQANQTNVHKSLMLARELIAITDHLNDSGIDVLPYKGVALAECIYGDLALRHSGDIDLLVHAADLSRVREAVRELGYTPHSSLPENLEQAYLRSGYECVFDGVAGPNLLEVQWAIQPRFYAVDFDIEGVFHRSVVMLVAGQPMKTLSPQDLFIVLSLHAAKHVWSRLIWLCDLERIMNLPSLDWNWIGSEARELGIGRVLRVTMLLTKRVLGANIPAAAEQSLPADSSADNLSEEIEPLVASGTPYNSESVGYFRLMLKLRERNSDRLRFLTRLMFTPGPSEWEAVRLPKPLFPLYRLIRLSRLAARLLRL